MVLPVTVRAILRGRDKYLAAFQLAEQIAADFMEDEIHRRAFDGFDHPVTYEGRITTTYKEYSDNLAMFRLKKLRPEYRENSTINNFIGPSKINIGTPTLSQSTAIEVPDEPEKPGRRLSITAQDNLSRTVKNAAGIEGLFRCCALTVPWSKVRSNNVIDSGAARIFDGRQDFRHPMPPILPFAPPTWGIVYNSPERF